MALIEGCLRGFHEETRRGGGGVGGFEFQFGGSIEGDGAKSLRTIPAIENVGGDRFVERTQRRSRRNLREEIRSFFCAGPEFVQMNLRRVGEIAGGETVDSFLEVGAGVSGLPLRSAVAAQPVESVHGAAGHGIFAKENADLVVGVRLAIEVSHPGDTPLGVVRVLVARENSRERARNNEQALVRSRRTQ